MMEMNKKSGFLALYLCLICLVAAKAQQTPQTATWEGDLILPYQWDDLHDEKPTNIANYNRSFLKWTISEREADEPTFSIFKNAFFDLIKNEKLQCFYDDSLTKSLSKPLDDKFSFEPLLHDMGVCHFKWSQLDYRRSEAEELAMSTKLPILSGYHIHTFLIKQHFKYFSATQTIENEVVAIAPATRTNLDKEEKEPCELSDFKPLFWVENPVYPNELAAKTAESTLIIRTRHKNITDTLFIDNKNIGSTVKGLVENILAISKNKTNTRLYDYSKSDKLLNTMQINSALIPPSDTIIKYDPVTFEEIVELVKNTKTDPSYYRKALILQQTWIFDRKTGAFATTNTKITPCLSVTEHDKKEIRFYRPLFSYLIENPTDKTKSKAIKWWQKKVKN